jgi:hypothetical protein
MTVRNIIALIKGKDAQAMQRLGHEALVAELPTNRQALLATTTLLPLFLPVLSRQAGSLTTTLVVQ